MSDVRLIPSYATIEEGAFSLIAESERSFTEMMKDIGISELHSFEESGIVMEAVNVKETIGKIVKWFEEQWEKIKKFVDECLVKIQKKISEAKKNVVKWDKFKKAVENLKAGDKVYATTYEYPHLDKMADGSDELMKKVGDYDLALRSDFSKQKKIVKDGGYVVGDLKEVKEDLEGYKKGIIDAIGGENDTKSIKKIKEYIRGKEVNVDKTYIVNHSRAIYDCATEYNEAARQLKKLYNEAKKGYAADIKFIKERKEEEYGYLNVYLPYLKFGKDMYRDLLTTTIGCVSERVRTSMMICLKVSLAIKAKEEKGTGEASSGVIIDTDGSKGEVAEESAIQTTKFESELATLFDF